MRVVMTLLVRDEEEVILDNLRFHLDRGVDHVVVTDNLSRDRTVDLLAPYCRSGEVTLWHERNDNYAQSRWVTRMARYAGSVLKADWVINSDADEFWFAPGSDLSAALADVPRHVGVVVAHRHNLAPVVPQGEPWWDGMVWRERVSRNLMGQPLPPKVCHRGSPTVRVAQGNHSVAGFGQPEDEGRLEILHAHVRSLAHLEHKIAVGGAAYARNTELPVGIGGAWRQLHTELHADGLAGRFGAIALSRGREDAGPDYVRDERLSVALGSSAST